MVIINTTDIHRILFTKGVQIKCHKCEIFNNKGKQQPLFFLSLLSDADKRQAMNSKNKRPI